MNHLRNLTAVLIIVLVWANYGWAQSSSGKKGTSSTTKQAPKAEPSSSTAPAQQQGSDKMDLKQLEDKYWSAKDSDYSVVQNRTYTKEKRFYASLTFGGLLNDPYTSGKMHNFSAGYYFSEQFGLELSHETGTVEDNASTKFIVSAFGVKPNYNKFVSFTGMSALWVPLYAKMSFVDKAIWYFDLQLGAGLGMLNYEIQLEAPTANLQRSVPCFSFDVTAQIFSHKNLSFRLDLKNKFSTQELKKYRNPVGQDLGTALQQDTTLHFGVTYFH